MQGKALTALATLVAALALAACGGGDDGGETSAGGGETAPAQVPAQIEERTDEIEKERQGGSGGSEADADRQANGGGSGAKGSAGSGERPASSSPGQSVSGGGAAQFQTKGGDNSIQEFGQEGGGSELVSAAAVLHAYLDARVARDWEEACSYFSAEVVAGLEQFAGAYADDKQIEGCPAVLERLTATTSTAAFKEAAKADVGALRMEGERGFLLFHGAGGERFAFPVTQEGGEWKLAAPDATPLL